MNKIFKIGLFADGPWSHKLINLIKADRSMQISFICKRYKTDDKKLSLISKKLNIPQFKFKNIKDKLSIKKIKRFECDIFVSMSYDQIFSDELINLTPLKIINCHAGHLPRYRGRNVLNWVLINGEKNFYITIHYIDKNIDTGPIILKKKFNIKKNDNYLSLLNKAYIHCPLLMFRVIKKIRNKKKLKLSYQPRISKKMYYRRRILGDEIINFNQKTSNMINFVRALYHPNLYARFKHKNKFYYIYKAKSAKSKLNLSEKNIPAGTILNVNKNYFDIKTVDNKIRLYTKNKLNLKVGECLKKH